MRIVSVVASIPTPSAPADSRAEPCPVFLLHPLTFCHYIRQGSAAVHSVFMAMFFFQKWVARPSFFVCLSLEAPLKPVYHGWLYWYLKSQWHSFQHQSNKQPPQYDNQQMGGVVPRPGSNPGQRRWEQRIVTTRPPGLALLIMTISKSWYSSSKVGCVDILVRGHVKILTWPHWHCFKKIPVITVDNWFEGHCISVWRPVAVHCRIQVRDDSGQS